MEHIIISFCKIQQIPQFRGLLPVNLYTLFM